MQSAPLKSKKITPLESMRGIAALMVFFFHFILGFMPQRHGMEAGTAIKGGNLIETPFFFLINGTAAVVFFFVLSGFVLSQSYFTKQSNDGLIIAVIKRWPRLFPLALISVIFSWLLIQFDLYFYLETAAITNSQWMQQFARARGDFLNSSFNDAFMQGFFYTFFRGDQNLNTSLWTMKHELIGSLLVFGLIPLVNGLKAKQAFVLFVLVMTAAFYSNVYMCAFIMGCFLSYFRCQVRDCFFSATQNRLLFIICFSAIILAFGYLEPGRGFYSWANIDNRKLMTALRIILHAVASVALIQLILNYHRFYKALNGPIGLLLGRCSFALYVIHVPLIFSFSSYVFLSLLHTIGYKLSVLVSFVLTLPLLFAISYAMSVVDERWCRKVNAIARKHIN